MDNQNKIVHSSFRDGQLVEVVDSGEWRTLYFGKRTLQSRQNLYQPQQLSLRYTQFMMSNLPLLANPPSRVLILGVGGGSLIHFIHHHYPDCRIDAVDRNDYILQVAQTYFDVAPSPTIKLHCSDGLDFLLDCPKNIYDLILVDTYSETGMADTLFDPRFFPSSKKCLKKGGIVTCNLWSGEKRKLKEVQNGIDRCFQATMLIPVTGKGNIVSHSTDHQFPWKNIRQATAVFKRWQERTGVDMVHIMEVAIRQNYSWKEKLRGLFSRPAPHHQTH